MEKIDFVFSLSLLNELTSSLITLSTVLQQQQIDLIQCCKEVAQLRNTLSNLRETERIFHKVFDEAMFSK